MRRNSSRLLVTTIAPICFAVRAIRRSFHPIALPIRPFIARTEVARACGEAGRGEVNSFPSRISATRLSGTLSKSSYVARRRAGFIDVSESQPGTRLVKIGDVERIFLVLTRTAFVPGGSRSQAPPGNARFVRPYLCQSGNCQALPGRQDVPARAWARGSVYDQIEGGNFPRVPLAAFIPRRSLRPHRYRWGFKPTASLKTARTRVPSGVLSDWAFDHLSNLSI